MPKDLHLWLDTHLLLKLRLKETKILSNAPVMWKTLGMQCHWSMPISFSSTNVCFGWYCLHGPWPSDQKDYCRVLQKKDLGEVHHLDFLPTSAWISRRLLYWGLWKGVQIRLAQSELGHSSHSESHQCCPNTGPLDWGIFMRIENDCDLPERSLNESLLCLNNNNGQTEQ